jgi:hypothetical protein
MTPMRFPEWDPFSNNQRACENSHETLWSRFRFFYFLFLYLSLKLKTQPIQLRDRPFNMKGKGAWFFAYIWSHCLDASTTFLSGHCVYIFFLNVTLFYVVKILSQIFFLYPSPPKYFFLKIYYRV